MTKRAITIYDIAERTGVSSSTVSRVLNGFDGVNPEKRELVLQAAEEMNYKANQMARGLKRDATRIAFLVTECASEFQARVLKGAQQACKELKESTDINLNGDFCIIPRGSTQRSMIRKIEEMIQENVDGLIFSPASAYGYEGILQKLKEKGIPVATVTSDIDSEDVLFSVRSDSKAEGKIAANLMHLLGIPKGGKVVVFTGRGENMGNRQNVESFIEASAKYNFYIDSVLDDQDDDGWARKVASDFFREGQPVDCVYIGTPVALPILEEMENTGYLGKTKVITTNTSKKICEYLKRECVSAAIEKNAEIQGRTAFMKMYDYLTEKKQTKRYNFIAPTIIVEANMDS